MSPSTSDTSMSVILVQYRIETLVLGHVCIAYVKTSSGHSGRFGHEFLGELKTLHLAA